jgi:non-specific serine/threonine protein kinase
MGDTDSILSAILRMLSPRKAQGVLPDVSKLSPRELEVLGLLAGGMTNRQIAEELVISRPTAERHVHHVLMKLGFANRVEAATWAAARSHRN